MCASIFAFQTFNTKSCSLCWWTTIILGADSLAVQQTSIAHCHGALVTAHTELSNLKIYLNCTASLSLPIPTPSVPIKHDPPTDKWTEAVWILYCRSACRYWIIPSYSPKMNWRPVVRNCSTIYGATHFVVSTSCACVSCGQETYIHTYLDTGRRHYSNYSSN